MAALPSSEEEEAKMVVAVEADESPNRKEEKKNFLFKPTITFTPFSICIFGNSLEVDHMAEFWIQKFLSRSNGRAFQVSDGNCLLRNDFNQTGGVGMRQWLLYREKICDASLETGVESVPTFLILDQRHPETDSASLHNVVAILAKYAEAFNIWPIWLAPHYSQLPAGVYENCHYAIFTEAPIVVDTTILGCLRLHEKEGDFSYLCDEFDKKNWTQNIILDLSLGIKEESNPRLRLYQIPQTYHNKKRNEDGDDSDVDSDCKSAKDDDTALYVGEEEYDDLYGGNDFSDGVVSNDDDDEETKKQKLHVVFEIVKTQERILEFLQNL